ncbi:MAG TPA: nitroreductase/quinone reductase family protein [Acidimicrobiales bacterium]|nr:nitroreductase/quinone reductase family protein [Acidimicrobiales bacterium]
MESLKTFLVKHVVSPIDRVSFRLTGGRVRLTIGRPVLLLSTLGRRTGQVRSTPVFYLRDGPDLVVCNVRPPGERANPWPRNLDHQPAVEVTVAGRRRRVTARRATEEEIDRLWPRLIRIWPLYADYYRHTKERHVFVLTPRSDTEDAGRGRGRYGFRTR